MRCSAMYMNVHLMACRHMEVVCSVRRLLTEEDVLMLLSGSVDFEARR